MKDSKQLKQSAQLSEPEDQLVAEDGEVEMKEPPEPFLSHDDDPSKKFEFLEFKKILGAMPSGTASVGSILGAMVYQIGVNAEQRQHEALDPQYYEKPRAITKRISDRGVKRKSTMQALQANMDEQAMSSVFDDAL